MTESGASTALLRPSDACRAIGIKPSTLRVYVQRFGELLSDDAVAHDRPGHRLYSGRDISLLTRARELLDRGYTYERAAAELRAQTPPARGHAAAPQRGRAPRSSSGEGAGEQLAALEQALSAWRALAEERAVEVARLREEVRELRALLLSSRRETPTVRARRRHN